MTLCCESICTSCSCTNSAQCLLLRYITWIESTLHTLPKHLLVLTHRLGQPHRSTPRSRKTSSAQLMTSPSSRILRVWPFSDDAFSAFQLGDGFSLPFTGIVRKCDRIWVLFVSPCSSLSPCLPKPWSYRSPYV